MKREVISVLPPGSIEDERREYKRLHSLYSAALRAGRDLKLKTENVIALNKALQIDTSGLRAGPYGLIATNLEIIERKIQALSRLIQIRENGIRPGDRVVFTQKFNFPTQVIKRSGVLVGFTEQWFAIILLDENAKRLVVGPRNIDSTEPFKV